MRDPSLCCVVLWIRTETSKYRRLHSFNIHSSHGTISEYVPPLKYSLHLTLVVRSTTLGSDLCAFFRKHFLGKFRISSTLYKWNMNFFVFTHCFKMIRRKHQLKLYNFRSTLVSSAKEGRSEAEAWSEADAYATDQWKKLKIHNTLVLVTAIFTTSDISL